MAEHFKYEEMTDEELIDQLREGDRQVMDYICDKYKNLVRSKAKSMYILGGDSEDLIQEGMIGLFKAVRDYDNLELKAVIDVIATFCLTDDTGALCDSFQTTRFGYSSSTVITVMPKNCFSAWLSTPKSAETRPPLFPKNS